MGVEIYVGQVMRHTYNPGYLVLSYFVSFAGCWTTLELLHRRTCSRGIYNWFLLIGAATAMGAVAIWCMHYIGNRAIEMLDGESELQIEYAASYTAASFFLPICVEGLTFYYFNQTDKVTVRRTILGGVTAGLAVCGMHYTGQGGISNYSISYKWQYVVGAAFIAVAANTAAFGIFFYFTMTWTNGMWKKIGCALLLAVSVSGMHWTATLGTIHRFAASSRKNRLSRKGIVIIVLCLGLGCCVILLFLAVLGSRSRKKSADRAQQVALASATFDHEGRLMVTPEGLLPCRKITNSYIERSFEDIFDVSHPVFCWIFRASHCWQSVVGLIPGIRAHLRATSAVNASRPESRGTQSGRRSLTPTESSEDYSSLFKELFCVAAQDLATLIQQPLENMGVLFEGIMNTGTIRKASRIYLFRKLFTRIKLCGPLADPIEAAERGRANLMFGRGQLLFVVRRLSKADATQMQAVGYRFASIANVIEILARSMLVTKEQLLPYLEKLQMHAANEPILEPGVHVACFALKPLLHRGFDVVVRQDARNLLPTYPLPLSRLERSHTEVLNQMDNWTFVMCCDWLRGKSTSSEGKEFQFYSQLLQCITALFKQIERPTFHEARLIARPFKVPCRASSSIDSPDHALVIVFRGIVDIHQHTVINENFLFSPSRFFLCQQRVYGNTSHNAAFGGRIHQEMAALAKNIDRKNEQQVKSSPRKSFQCLPSVPRDFMRRDSTASTLDQKWLFSRRPSASTAQSQRTCVDKKGSMRASRQNSIFGGIHVSSEIRINAERGENSLEVELPTLGVRTEASAAELEPETFADQLMKLTTNERRRERAQNDPRID